MKSQRGRRKCPAANTTANTTGAIAPNNKNWRPQSESKKEKEKSHKKDLHSTKGNDAPTKKTPTVRINESSEAKNNSYDDLDYSSDDGSAMMVQVLNNKQLNGITVIEVPRREGNHHATTILIDDGFTGYAMMSHPFAKQLGYKFQHKRESLIAQRQGTKNREVLEDELNRQCII